MSGTVRTKLDDLLDLGGGARRLRIVAESPIDLWLEGDSHTASVALLAGPLPDALKIPDVASGDVIAVTEEVESNGRWVVVRLSELGFLDVFSHLAEDLADATLGGSTPRDSISHLLARLAAWNRLFQAVHGGLSVNAQKGLFGELGLLRQLVNALGPLTAVQAWTGPNGGTRDFECGTSAIEVKTTSARAPYKVRVSSERQLDPTAADPLFLWATVIQSAPSGTSLNDAVDELRAIIEPDPVATYDFEHRLLRVGYVDSNRQLHRERFEIVDSLAFQVSGRFPRIDERSLPEGIGSVHYELALSACTPWEVEATEVIDAFRN